jgi:hypothetical protein
MKKHLIFLLLFLVGCNKFYLQRSQISQNQLPNSCEGIVELVNSQWLKSKKQDCRFDNGVYETIERDYEPCIKGMTKAQIQSLFGKPDNLSWENLFYYFFDEKCTNESRRSQKYLEIGFENDKVIFVRTGTRQAVS